MKSLFFAVVLAASLSAQTSPMFHGGVSLVHIDTGVVLPSGRVVTGLKGSDFRIFDNEQEQKLAGFAAEEQPLELILLFDVSGSMHRAIGKVVAAGQRALHELRPGDSVCVMSFTSDLRLISRFTEDLAAVENGLNLVAKDRFRGSTYIQDSVRGAARQFPRHDDGTRRRRAVLVITDNVGRKARSEMAVVEELWEADAVLSGLIVAHREPVAASILGPILLGRVNRIAEMTGGETIRSDDLGDSFVDMLHRLRTRYSLYYRLPEDQPDGALRKVRVELTPEAQERFPGAKIFARQGYRMHARDPNGFAVR